LLQIVNQSINQRKHGYTALYMSPVTPVSQGRTEQGWKSASKKNSKVQISGF